MSERWATTAAVEGRGIAVDSSGDAYVSGRTVSDQSTFPVKAGPDLTFNGDQDPFVAKVRSIPDPPANLDVYLYLPAVLKP